MGVLKIITEHRRKELISICQELIKIKSYSGKEGEVAKKISQILINLGYDDYSIDEYGNIIGVIKGKRPGEKILFDGHIDTVPVGNESEWSVPPFRGDIKENKIYGRGASDMKGAVASMICAGAYFAQDRNKDFSGEIYIAGVVHEECFEGVAARNISRIVRPDYVVIGEASELNLKIGQRGRAEIVVETFGKPAHSANPDKGINAVYNMCKLIEKIKLIKPKYDEFLGFGLMELTDIKSNPYPGASVVPDYCRVTYDRRLLIGENKNSVLEPIIQIINDLESEDHDFKAKVSFAMGEETCYTGNTIIGERFFPAWKLRKDHDYVAKIYKGLKDVNLNPEITNYSFCTNGSHYAGEEGITTIGFGPSKENLAHTIDEYIEIDELVNACIGYYSIINSTLV